MIYVDPNWTYKEAVEYIRNIKGDYQRVLSSFSIWQAKERADFIVDTRNRFYKLRLQQWQIDNLWKFMNNYLAWRKLVESAKRYK